jgi:hypothetical protein
LNPNVALRYTPALTVPESSFEFAVAAGFLTCFDDAEDDGEDDDEDCAGACP